MADEVQRVPKKNISEETGWLHESVFHFLGFFWGGSFFPGVDREQHLIFYAVVLTL